MALGPSDPPRPSADSLVWPGQAPTLYETPLSRIGRRGVNLQDALDDLDPSELSRMVNVVSRYGGALAVRPGQAPLGTTTPGYLHRLFRLNDPLDSTFARFAGLGTTLWRGTTGAFTQIDTGYSGDPLTFTGVNMPRGQDPSVFITDRSRMRKVTRTGAVEPIGLAPATAPTLALQGQSRVNIAEFDASDGTHAAAWTATAGQDRAATPNASGVPVVSDIFGATAIEVRTVPGAATTGYDSSISVAKAMDLTVLDSGPPTIAATDDDHTRILFNVSDPAVLEEFKVYFVISTPFVLGAIPGTGAGNDQAWFKSFRPSDLQEYTDRAVSGLTASDTLRTRTLLERFKIESLADTRAALLNIRGALDLPRMEIPAIGAGKNVWAEFGVPGVPLRRGEWQRIGQDQAATRGWNTITGIVLVIQTATVDPITIQLVEWFLYGGSGPDNSDPGASAYDVRVRHLHTRTGTVGNPSPILPEASWVNVLRQTIQVTPPTFGDANVRQQAFMRGGSAAGTTDWFFAGENTSDGGGISITISDNVRITEESLEIDNDQPVTSTDPFGGTALSKIVPIMFQVEGYTFALGDGNQPGRLYRSKLDRPEQWPAIDYVDVSPAADPLMNGGAWTTGGFVFSEQRLHRILIAADGSWTTEPTECAEGLVGRWAMAITPYGIAFVSPFGVRLTQGGAPAMISDEQLGRVFRGETVHGFLPVDYTADRTPQLEYADDELWVTYADSGGTRRQWIYSFKEQTWRHYLFGETVGTVYTEPISGAAGSILLGGSATGQVYTHSGFNDDGASIAYVARTGAWDFGEPRREKMYTDVVLDAELQTGTTTVQTFLDTETITNTAQNQVGTAGERRYLFEPFGTTPQHGRNVSVEVRGNAPTTSRPAFNRIGVTRRLEPEISQLEPTPWEELPGGEGYVWGCFITCDTSGSARTVLVEGTTSNGAITTLATLSVTAAGRKKLPFTWTAALAQQIRLRPTGAGTWIRYKVEWFTDSEPPRVVGWDTNWQSFGTGADKWIKGYLLEADTFNAAKTVVLDVDQSLASNSQALTFNGRGVQHISFAKVRGRLFRLRTTDANPGKFYRWQPIFDEEPLALTRWETQERPFTGLAGRWQKPLEAFVTLRSSAAVNWQLIAYGASSTTLDTSNYPFLTTGGTKSKIRVPLNAVKGLLFSHLFTSSAPHYIYREESEVLVEDWETGQASWVPLFPSNSDLDPVREMGDAASRASTPNQ